MRTKKTNTAFTLLEVLMASVIFVLTVSCIYVTLNGVRVEVTNKENQLAATNMGRQVLETLHSQMNNTTYYSNSCVGGVSTVFDLSVCTHQVPVANLPSGLSWPTVLASPCNGTLSYTVSCADGSSGPNCTNQNIARRVDVNVNWPSSASGTC